MTIEQVRTLLAKECAKAGGQKAWADRYGVSAAYVSDVIGARREPGSKVLDALGLVRVSVYRPVKRKGKEDGE